MMRQSPETGPGEERHRLDANKSVGKFLRLLFSAILAIALIATRTGRLDLIAGIPALAAGLLYGAAVLLTVNMACDPVLVPIQRSACVIVMALIAFFPAGPMPIGWQVLSWLCATGLLVILGQACWLSYRPHRHMPSREL